MYVYIYTCEDYILKKQQIAREKKTPVFFFPFPSWKLFHPKRPLENHQVKQPLATLEELGPGRMKSSRRAP